MEIELITDKHYDIISNWWIRHNKPIIQKDLLSTSGFIVKESDAYLVAVWVYKTNSALCGLEFLVSNPEVVGIKRDESIDFLINFTLDYIRLSNYKAVFCTIENSKVMERANNLGFSLINKNVSNFMRSI